jgi:hypothetical protein
MPEQENSAAVQVINSQGNVKFSQQIQSDSKTVSTDLSGLPDGFYFIRVFTKSVVYSGKIQIIH